MATSSTDPTIIATAVVTVISALVIGVVTVINALAAASERKDARASRENMTKTTNATDRKADTLIEKATEIHTLTNSNLSKVTASLGVALAKIEGLEKLVLSMNDAKKVADTLASGPERPATLPPADATSQAQAVEESLNKIDTNTAATAKNTARTEASVEALKDKS